MVSISLIHFQVHGFALIHTAAKNYNTIMIRQIIIRSNSKRSYHSTSSLQMGFLDNAISKVKGIFSSDDDTKTKKSEIVESRRGRREDREQAGGLMNQMLKDAPLPVRLMGKLVAPMVSSVMESMGEQARQVEDLMDDARGMLMRDARVVDMLGEPIEVATTPFQQSSSSMNVNGKTTTKVQVSFQVQGSRGEGIATMSASGGEKASIDSLSVKIGGKVINVDASLSGSGRAFSSSSASEYGNASDNNIIDAEFVEKKYNQ